MHRRYINMTLVNVEGSSLSWQFFTDDLYEALADLSERINWRAEEPKEPQYIAAYVFDTHTSQLFIYDIYGKETIIRSVKPR